MSHVTSVERALPRPSLSWGGRTGWVEEGQGTQVPRLPALPPPHCPTRLGGIIRDWTVPALSCQGLLHHSTTPTFAWKMPMSVRAGKNLEQPLKVSSQLNLIKLQFQKPAAFS